MMQITELDVWKSAMDLTQKLFELSKDNFESDKHELASMIRQTSVDVPSNIASAASKKYGKDSLRYLFDAKNGIYKIESQLHLAHRLNYITEEQFDEIINELDTSRRLLFGFIKHYKRTAYGNRRAQDDDEQ